MSAGPFCLRKEMLHIDSLLPRSAPPPHPLHLIHGLVQPNNGCSRSHTPPHPSSHVVWSQECATSTGIYSTEAKKPDPESVSVCLRLLLRQSHMFQTHKFPFLPDGVSARNIVRQCDQKLIPGRGLRLRYDPRPAAPGVTPRKFPPVLHNVASS